MKAEHAHSQKHTETRKLFYQRVAAIIGQDDDINGCCVIGHTDTAILWFVLSEIKQVCLRHTNIQSQKRKLHIHRSTLSIPVFEIKTFTKSS